MVSRAPKKQREVDDFLPCQFCLVFFVKDELYRHCQKCQFRSDTSSLKGCVGAARALLLGSLTADGSGDQSELSEHVLPQMRIDMLKKVAV